MTAGFYIADDQVDEIIKDPADDLPYALAFYDWLRGSDQYWSHRRIVKPGETYTPAAAALNGYRYRCKKGGLTGNAAPTWPTTGSADITDGGVTWVLIGAEDTLATVSVTPESGLTADSPELDETGTRARFNLSGGTAGRAYLVTVEVATTQSKTKQTTFRVRMRES